MDGQEPAQITVTVFSARNLQSRNKGEICQASVVFGVGKDCYVTETITSCTPEWKQEACINLLAKAHAHEIKFKVRDKEHTLGVAFVLVSNLSQTREGSKRWVPLTPHKKSHEAHGEILVECFISQVRPGTSHSERASPNISLSNSQEDLHATHKGGGVVRGVKERFSFHRRNPSWSKTSASPTSPTIHEKRLSGSDMEIHSKQSKLNTFISDGNIRSHSSSEQKVNNGQAAESMAEKDYNLLVPEVSGISPREGPVGGGQRVVLRGSCLGECKSDVVRVSIADVDCTKSLEYQSQSKLVVTTTARFAAGQGPVLVETHTGGIGISSLIFTFTRQEVCEPPEVTGISPRDGAVTGGERVVLRGNYLGESKDDVVRVEIAGMDCTQTLEYFSHSKLAVTTLPCHSLTSGPVLIETVRGGIGQSSLIFSYVASSNTSGEGSVPASVNETNPSTKKKHPEVDPVEFKALKQQLRDLKEDNSVLKNDNLALRKYIDELIVSVMAVKPDLLEVKSSVPTIVIQTSKSFIS